MTNYLSKIHGVDVTEIYGIKEGTALEILSETGNLLAWENENKFVSWLNLCPNNKITGGKLISSMVMKRKAGNATQAFRAAANSVQRSDNWLGDYFRRMKSKGGNKYAIIAVARKIAIIYYKMVTQKQKFKPVEIENYREKHKTAKIAYLEKQLAKLKTA
jgi:transposase